MKKLFGIKRLIFLSITAFCMFVIAFATFNPVFAETNDAAIIRKHQETQNKIRQLKVLEKKETNKLFKNQQKLETTAKDLEYSKKRYDVTKHRLDDLESELAIAVADYNKTLVKVRHRIRNIFMHHRKNLFELLISADDVNSFMDNIYFQNIITKTDKNSLYNVRKKAQRIARIRYEHEQEKKRLANFIQDMNSKQIAIQAAIGKNEEIIKKLRTDRQAYEKAERELARQSKNLEGIINRETSSSSSSEMKVVSGFIKPIAGPITSPYGWRVHPIFKSRTFHSGIDIGGANNGAIQASNSGKVIYAGWYGGYGKVVIIDHGMYNGAKVTTLYAHMNTWTVNVGQYVSRGQIIGREGTTGYSTGPHLHFEVRVNGQTRNPLSYI